MKYAIAIIATLVVYACANPGAKPSDIQVQQIENACAVDAGIRPTITAFMAIPGLVQPAEDAAIIAARAVIDPICANPAGNVQSNAISALTSASAQVVGIVAQIQARKNAAQ